VRLVAVMVGGAVGAVARWAVELAIPSVAGFPLATLVINVSGAFAMGLVGVLLLERLAPTRYLRPLLGIGLLGAYTTFSTMAMEGVRLVEQGRFGAGGWLLGGHAAGRADGRGLWDVAGTATAAKEATWS
jgi:CrcB protein